MESPATPQPAGVADGGAPPLTKGGPRRGRLGAIVFGAINLMMAGGYAYLFFVLIPSRHAAFQAAVGVVCALLAGGGLGLLTGRRWGLVAGVVGAATLLVAGLALIWGLFASAAYLHGIYGGFGRGAAAVLLAVVALVFELVCLVPVIQLVWLRRALRR